MDDGRAEWDRMLAGEPYDGTHECFFVACAACEARKAALDAAPPQGMEGRFRVMQALFGALEGPCNVQPPIDVEYGRRCGWAHDSS